MKKIRFKKGVASFYIVAFAALLLVIVASSFALVVVSEIGRASNSDLSRSAYDSALAGVEDAKLAVLNYQACLEQGYTYTGSLSNEGSINCNDIIYYMKNPNCDMVANILGRQIDPETGEVQISESHGAANNMSQAYTCVMVATTLSDYRADLNSSNSSKIINVSLEDESLIGSVKYIKLSWHSTQDETGLDYANFIEESPGAWRTAFQPVDDELAVPPMLSLQLIQTANSFTLGEVNSKMSLGGSGKAETDRATVFLVPTNREDGASESGETYVGAYSNDGGNEITAEQMAATNNLEKNLPYVVYCPDDQDGEFLCSVKIELPDPIGFSNGGGRNPDTFMFVVSLPYGQPGTEFALELCTVEEACLTQGAEINNGSADGVVILKDMQVEIDSTGKANDLYRRVKVRTGEAESASAYLPYAIQAIDNGNGNEVKIEKLLEVKSEYSAAEYGN